MTIANTYPSQARNLDAGTVLDVMSPERQRSFIFGMIEGLAYARFLRDRPDQSGYNCVRQWLITDAKARWPKIVFLFKRHQDKPPAVLLNTLIKKDCGD